MFCISKQELWGKLEFQSPLKHQNCRDCICLSQAKFPAEEWAEQASPAPSHMADGLTLLWAWPGECLFTLEHVPGQPGRPWWCCSSAWVTGWAPLSTSGHHFWGKLLQLPASGGPSVSCCICSVLSLWGIKAVSYWELKQCVSHNCREAQRCFAGVAGQWEGSCGSKLHFRCICSTQAWQLPPSFQQHEHLVPFHFSNLIESLSMTWALGKCSLLEKNKSNFDYTGLYCLKKKKLPSSVSKKSIFSKGWVGK